MRARTHTRCAPSRMRTHTLRSHARTHGLDTARLELQTKIKEKETMKLKKHNDIATLQQRLEQKTLGANKQVWYPARHGIPRGAASDDTVSRAA